MIPSGRGASVYSIYCSIWKLSHLVNILFDHFSELCHFYNPNEGFFGVALYSIRGFKFLSSLRIRETRVAIIRYLPFSNLRTGVKDKEMTLKMRMVGSKITKLVAWVEWTPIFTCNKETERN